MPLSRHILATLEDFEQLHVSGENDLYRFSREHPDYLMALADQQALELTAKIA